VAVFVCFFFSILIQFSFQKKKKKSFKKIGEGFRIALGVGIRYGALSIDINLGLCLFHFSVHVCLFIHSCFFLFSFFFQELDMMKRAF